MLLFVHELCSSVFLSGKLLNDFGVKVRIVLYQVFLHGEHSIAVRSGGLVPWGS